jgi:hypothetical protein
MELYHKLGNEVVINSALSDDSFNLDTYAYDYPLQFKYHVEEFRTLFIASDGIASFIVGNPAEQFLIYPPDLLPKFMAFKGVKGEFLKRRMKKALKNLRKRGTSHFDDLSIGSYISC